MAFFFPSTLRPSTLFLCSQIYLFPCTSSSSFLCLSRGSDPSLYGALTPGNVVQCQLELKVGGTLSGLGRGLDLRLPGSNLDTTTYIRPSSGYSSLFPNVQKSHHHNTNLIALMWRLSELLHIQYVKVIRTYGIVSFLEVMKGS